MSLRVVYSPDPFAVRPYPRAHLAFSVQGFSNVSASGSLVPGQGSFHVRFPPNVIESVLVVGLEIGVLELPSLSTSNVSHERCEHSIVTYADAVGRVTAFFVVVPYFVEVVLVELSDEASEVAVFEVLGQDGFGKLLVLEHDEAVALVSPTHHRVV